MHALSRALTPGNPVYGLLKMGALAGVVGLRVAMTRRSRAAEAPPQPSETTTARRDPHSRSKKKKRKRR